MKLSKKEKAALDKWHGKIQVSSQDRLNIYRLCEKENANYDEVIKYALYSGYRIIYIDENFIKEYLKEKNSDKYLLDKLEKYMKDCDERHK